MLVGHGGHTFQVEHVRVRVAEGLSINYFGVGLDGSLKSLEVVHVKNGVRDALRS